MVFTFIKRDLVKRKLVRAGEPNQDCGHKVAGLAKAISEAETLKYSDQSCHELAQAKRHLDVVSDKHKISSRLKVTMARGLQRKQRTSNEERLAAHDDLCDALIVAYEAELCKDLWAPALRLVRDLEALLATSKLHCRRFSRDPASMRKKHGAANRVQRTYRGHCGRSRARERKQYLEEVAREEWEFQRMREIDAEETERARLEAEEEARTQEEAKRARLAALVKGGSDDEEDSQGHDEDNTKMIVGDASSSNNNNTANGDGNEGKHDEGNGHATMEEETSGAALMPKPTPSMLSLVAQRCAAAHLQKASPDLGPGVVLFAAFGSQDMQENSDQGAVDQVLRTAAKSVLLHPSLAKNKVNKFEPLVQLAKHKRPAAHLLLVAQQEHPLLHRLVEAFQSETQALADSLGPPEESEEEEEEEEEETKQDRDQQRKSANSALKDAPQDEEKNDVLKTLPEDPELTAAATRIQARYRGNAARITLAEAAQPRASAVRQGPLARQIGNDDELSKAAARIQANYRGMMSRRSFTVSKSSETLESKQGSLMASTLNTTLPGFDELEEGDEDEDAEEGEAKEERNDRGDHGDHDDHDDDEAMEDEETMSEQPKEDEIKAATRIQATFRGKAARRVLSTENTDEIEETLRGRLEEKLLALAESEDGKLEELLSNSKETLRSRLETKLVEAQQAGTLEKFVKDAKAKVSPPKRLQQKVGFAEPSKKGSMASNVSVASKKPIRSMKTELFHKLQNRRRQNGEEMLEEVEEEEVQEWAATRIQAVHRGRSARREVEKRRQSVKLGVSFPAEEEDDSASGMAKDKNGRTGQEDEEGKDNSTGSIEAGSEVAANDARVDGKSNSKSQSNDDSKEENEDSQAAAAGGPGGSGGAAAGAAGGQPPRLSFGPSTAEEERAATKIQAIHRGRKVRCNIYRKDTPTAPRDYVDKGKDALSSLAFMSISEDEPMGSDGTLNSARSRTGFLPPILDEEGEEEGEEEEKKAKEEEKVGGEGEGRGLSEKKRRGKEKGSGSSAAVSRPAKLEVNVVVAPSTTPGFELTIVDPFMHFMSF